MVDLNLKVPAIEMLLKYTASGIGAVAGSILAPRWRARQAAAVRRIEAEAEGDSLKLIAKAQAEARQILIEPGNAGSGILEISPDGGITQRIEYQEKKRQANIAAVVQGVAAGIGDKEVPEHEPDPDWTARFFDCVQDVSSEDMQKLWSQVLSGEVENPGRTSLRTLDILKNMTREDAGVFDLAGNFVISDFIFNPKYEKDIDLALDTNGVIQLQEAGLLHADTSLVTTRKFENRNVYIVYHDYMLRITSLNPEKENISIPAIPLTRSGKEIFEVLKGKVSMTYLRSFSKFLFDEECGLSCALIVDKRPSDGAVKLQDFVVIEPVSRPPDSSES